MIMNEQGEPKIQWNEKWNFKVSKESPSIKTFKTPTASVITVTIY
jgi:hypothetical protein